LSGKLGSWQTLMYQGFNDNSCWKGLWEGWEKVKLTIFSPTHKTRWDTWDMWDTLDVPMVCGLFLCGTPLFSRWVMWSGKWFRRKVATMFAAFIDRIKDESFW